MQRRNFLIGVSSTAVAGSALLGTGAFSRVESQRNVAIAVAADPDAYLGMSQIADSLNSVNYVDLDGDGHLYIDVGQIPETENPIGGSGVNSDSFTYFDDLFQLCNQGKADADISYELPADGFDGTESWIAPDPDYDEQIVTFYFVRDDATRVMIQEGETVPLEVGECENIGLRTVTKGVDASVGQLIDDEVVITADSPEAGEVIDTSGSQ